MAMAPLRTQAQESRKTRVIGNLGIGHPPTAEQIARNPFFARMKERGWVEGTNLVMERRYAEFRSERLAGFAEELVRKGVDLLATTGPEATLAAARATRTIPIVFNSVTWPVEQGLISSFARPGRNVTGIASYTGVEVTNKRHEFLRAIAPAAKRLSWLWPPEYSETLSGGRFDMVPIMDAAVKGLGFEARFHDIRRSEDIEAALDELRGWRAQAISASGAHVSEAGQRIAEFALRERLPSVFPQIANVEAGGLLSYANAQAEFPRLLSTYVSHVDRILRGALPGELPVERPNLYELVINLKTAKALGLTVPQSLLIRADRVIE
jgi:putative ABC transport system substrate-binding protein